MNQALRAKKIVDYFSEIMPSPKTELTYNSEFELLVAVILSAQCTDKRVNMVTPPLFKEFPTPELLSKARFDDVFQYIKSVSYPNSKTKHIIDMANVLIRDFKGAIPTDRDELIKLPGVGRKTANVVLSVCHNAQVMPVDTHVFRVSGRIGLTKNAKNPMQCETQLVELFKDYDLHSVHHWLILFGRSTCIARSPKCDKCGLQFCCNYFNKS